MINNFKKGNNKVQRIGIWAGGGVDHIGKGGSTKWGGKCRGLTEKVAFQPRLGDGEVLTLSRSRQGRVHSRRILADLRCITGTFQCGCSEIMEGKVVGDEV